MKHSKSAKSKSSAQRKEEQRARDLFELGLRYYTIPFTEAEYRAERMDFKLYHGHDWTPSARRAYRAKAPSVAHKPLAEEPAAEPRELSKLSSVDTPKKTPEAHPPTSPGNSDPKTSMELREGPVTILKAATPDGQFQLKFD